MNFKLMAIMLFCMGISFSSYGQIEKGKKMIGINLSGSYKGDNRTMLKQSFGSFDYGNRMSDKQLDLRFGYFLFNRFSFGINPQIKRANGKAFETFSKISPNDTLEGSSLQIKTYRSTLFSLNPFLRFYVFRYKSLGAFAEASVGLSFARSYQKREEITTYGTGARPEQSVVTISSERFFNSKFGLGINYFITEKASVELSYFLLHNNITKSARIAGLYNVNYDLSIGFTYSL